MATKKQLQENVESACQRRWYSLRDNRDAIISALNAPGRVSPELAARVRVFCEPHTEEEFQRVRAALINVVTDIDRNPGSSAIADALAALAETERKP